MAIRAANAPASSAPVLSRSFFLRKNQSKSVVAHLTASGKPALTVYANDQSPLGRRAGARHRSPRRRGAPRWTSWSTTPRRSCLA